jgi:hypothetical protein
LLSVIRCLLFPASLNIRQKRCEQAEQRQESAELEDESDIGQIDELPKDTDEEVKQEFLLALEEGPLSRNLNLYSALTFARKKLARKGIPYEKMKEIVEPMFANSNKELKTILTNAEISNAFRQAVKRLHLTDLVITDDLFESLLTAFYNHFLDCLKEANFAERELEPDERAEKELAIRNACREYLVQ